MTTRAARIATTKPITISHETVSIGPKLVHILLALHLANALFFLDVSCPNIHEGALLSSSVSTTSVQEDTLHVKRPRKP